MKDQTTATVELSDGTCVDLTTVDEISPVVNGGLPGLPDLGHYEMSIRGERLLIWDREDDGTPFAASYPRDKLVKRWKLAKAGKLRRVFLKNGDWKDYGKGWFCCWTDIDIQGITTVDGAVIELDGGAVMAVPVTDFIFAPYED